jgi:chemotaxis protein methyltransferase CheR
VWEIKTLTPEQFALFERLIYRTTGIRMQSGKITLLSNRIRRRLRHHGLHSFEEYYTLLTAGSLKGELEEFIDAVTTNETYFFRTEGHFDWFRGEFLDEMASRVAAREHPRSLRLWSAACSSGEEVYTLAICLAEARGKLAGWQLKILGTDISGSSLEAARAARYEGRTLENVSPERLARHFQQSGDAWTVRPSVTKPCEFRTHNLLKPLGEKGFDAIFVRNVMIYFDRESKRTAVGHLLDALAPGGYLVVGPADGIYDLLGNLERKSSFLYHKPLSTTLAGGSLPSGGTH